MVTEGGGQTHPVPGPELMETGLSDNAVPLPLKLEPEELRAPKRRKTSTPMVPFYPLHILRTHTLILLNLKRHTRATRFECSRADNETQASAGPGTFGGV